MAPELTPDLARQALLEMVRSKPGQFQVFGDDKTLAEISKMETVKEENGWYAWTGAFRFNPSEARYVLTIGPGPGVRACVFESEGTFVSKDNRWVAMPPTAERSALQRGD
jgi:hypothetical protein